MKISTIINRIKVPNLTIMVGALFGLFYSNAAMASTATENAHTMLKNLGTLGGMLEAIAVIIGASLFVGSLFVLKRYGQMRMTFMAHQLTIARPLVMMIAGIMLLVIPTTMGTILLAVWGSASPMAYSSSGSSPWAAYVPVVITFVRLVGVVAFIRGLILMSRAGGHNAQPGSLNKSLMHLVGGAMCINVVATHSLLASILPI